jgi:hypothetical protein
LVNQSGNQVDWTGCGTYDGKPWSHQGWDTIAGSHIEGRFADLPDSPFYPKSRAVAGTVSKDRGEIRWQGMEPVWARQGAGADPHGGGADECQWREGGLYGPSKCLCRASDGMVYGVANARCGR